MKTNLFTSLLLCLALSMQAQDFRSVPPGEQPNSAELDYFGGNNPNLLVTAASDSSDIAFVTGFLKDLSSNQLEAAYRRLAEAFVVDGPGYNDRVETDSLFNQWERIGKQLTDQHLTIETKSTTVIRKGENRGKWVYVKGIWSATDKAVPGKSIRIPFHQVARITDGLIDRICVSYGADQFFYTLGFSLYSGPSDEATHR